MNNKKIVFRVTGTYMKKNLGRTLTTFAGILVMVVLMTAVFVGRDSVMKLMTDLMILKNGSWHAQMLELNREQVEAVKALPYVKEVGISRPYGYTEFEKSANPETPFLEIKGYSDRVYEWMGMGVAEGRLPQKEGEMVISVRAKNDGSTLKVGDTIRVDAFDRYIHATKMSENDEGFLVFGSGFRVEHGETKKLPPHFSYWESSEGIEMIHEPNGFTGEYTVVGFVTPPYYEAPGQAGYMAFVETNDTVGTDETVNLVLQTDLKGIREITGDLNRIVNSTKTPEEIEELLQSGSMWMSDSGERVPIEAGRVTVNDALLSVSGKGTDGTLNMIMIAFQVFFISLITAASLILIHNVFNISFRERSRYLGMLSSVGATRSQKRWSVYFEIFSLLTPALPLGILLGILVVKGGMMILYPSLLKVAQMFSESVFTMSKDVSIPLVVSPWNLLLVVAFCGIATWISAMIPAIRISKVGPIESIRGNVGQKSRDHKTDLRRMKHGKAEYLIADASVKRNPHASRGIILSITAFLSLTLITFFATGLFADVVKQKMNDSDLMLGEDFRNYPYLFYTDVEEDYEKCVELIENSEEVTRYWTLHYELFTLNIRPESISDEVKKAEEKVVMKYFPGGITEELRRIYLDSSEEIDPPVVNTIVLPDEDFRKVAAKAGIAPERVGLTGGVSGDGRVPALVLDFVAPSTKNIEIRGDGSVVPPFTRYEVSKPLSLTEGDDLGLFLYDYKKDQSLPFDLPVTFAGYVSANALSDYYEIMDGRLWIVLPESGNDHLLEYSGDVQRFGITDEMLMLDAPEGSEILERLAAVQTEFGESALHAGMGIIYDFSSSLIRIVRILAVCFTLLVAVISLLNLYNSVMGRHLALLKEQAVLRSLGMTRGQERKILILENARMLLTASLLSAGISSVFALGLHLFLSHLVGHLIFHPPFAVIGITLLVSVVSLVLFSIICYHKKSDGSLSEDLRKETA